MTTAIEKMMSIAMIVRQRVVRKTQRKLGSKSGPAWTSAEATAPA